MTGGEGASGDPAVIAAWFDAMAAAVWIVSGPDHHVVASNRAARVSAGPHAGVLGQPISEVMPELVNQQVSAWCDEVYRTGRSVTKQQLYVGGTSAQDCAAAITVTVDLAAGTQGRGLVVRVDIGEEHPARVETGAVAARLGQRLRQASDVVLTLQRSLLSAVLPVLPDVRLAARYLVASREQAAGGDWFDAVPLGGDLALVVGDVVGHGAAASGVMGQLRAVLMEFLLEGVGLLEALARLDRFAVRVPGGRGATVCVAKLDRSTGQLSYACCGHLPPMVISLDGTVRALSTTSGGLLGVDSAAPTLEMEMLSPGDVVLLYSDGLIERSGRPLQEGINMLSEVASAAISRGRPYPDSAADRICELVVEAFADGDYPDDVTVLAAEIGRPVSVPLAFTVEAVPGAVADLTPRMAGWLEAIGATEDDVMAIQVATAEAVANVFQHAYPDGEGGLQLEAMLDDDGRVCVTVADGGRWQTPGAGGRSRGGGLARMRSCMDSVEIEHDEDGTTVLMELQLTRPVIISDGLRDPDAPVPDVNALTTTLTTTADGPLVIVAGPLDTVTALEFADALRDGGRSGVLPLTIDLSAVTILASAGVKALHEHCEEAMSSGRRVRVIAPVGSATRDVLRFSGLTDMVDILDEC